VLASHTLLPRKSAKCAPPLRIPRGANAGTRAPSSLALGHARTKARRLFINQWHAGENIGNFHLNWPLDSRTPTEFLSLNSRASYRASRIDLDCLVVALDPLLCIPRQLEPGAEICQHNGQVFFRLPETRVQRQGFPERLSQIGHRT
jgi:hypothetical protein